MRRLALFLVSLLVVACAVIAVGAGLALAQTNSVRLPPGSYVGFDHGAEQEKPASLPDVKITEGGRAVSPVPAVPTLTRVDQLEIENALLKIDRAQAQVDKLKAEFTALLTGLQKPGYVIAQGQDGKLAYQPEPKQEKK